MSIMSPDVASTIPASGSPLLGYEEFVERYADRRAELVNGVVEELPVPRFPHGWVAATLTRLMGNHVAEHDAGWVVSHDTFVRVKRDPDTVRGPDLAYFSYATLPKGPVPQDPKDVIPDLVAEVKSPSDPWGQVFTKVGEYLDAWVRVVLVIDPDSQTALIYRGEANCETLHAADTLWIPDLLPGWELPLAGLFG